MSLRNLNTTLVMVNLYQIVVAMAGLLYLNTTLVMVNLFKLLKEKAT
ncbi:MAG: hypothetical protein ACRCYE_13810 [Sarcina sp.]